ncbi:MAG TPA: MMPL family transporter [Thermoplasmata archaeon]|nr:MMPL family transporter [Thermoplasmata archaeon]
MDASRGVRSGGRSPFAWLGRGIVRHPWYPIVLWGVVLAIALPGAASVGSVISNSFGSTIPSTDESVVAQNELAAEFPNQTQAPSSALVLLESANITDATGRNATIAVANALEADRNLTYVGSIATVYSAYAGYLAGQAELGLGFLDPALDATPSLPEEVNGTASAIWGPVRTYVAAWAMAAADLPSGDPPRDANWPAYESAASTLGSGTPGASVLNYFYNGFNASVPGFNATVSSSCLASLNVTPCADSAARTTLSAATPGLAATGAFAAPANASIAPIVLADLGVENATEWPSVQGAAATVLGTAVGLVPGWIDTLWQAFPDPTPSSADVAAWAARESVQPVPDPAVPSLPASLGAAFVNPTHTAALVVVSYSVSDTYVANGSTPTFDDDAEIAHAVARAVGGSAAFAGVSYYVTGESPLSSSASYLATSSLGVLLILTIVVLVVIMILYFRAPAAPLLTFGVIGVGVVVSLAIMFVLGTFVTTFNPEVQPVVLVFLMSIGTDYTVFLLARYREELVKGAAPKDAVETTVRWAGQSITTSGLTVAVVTTAMVFAGIGPLSQFGLALTFSVLATLLVALTLVPAILCFAGPRIFWPYTGARFRSFAERRNASVRSGRGAIARAGRLATRRPIPVLAVILLLSAPVVLVALSVPVSYDFTNIGLPASDPAQQGFAELTRSFGAGYTSPSFLLVSFTAPVLPNGAPDPTAFADIAGIAGVVASTPGIAAVGALVGPGGLSLAFWTNYSALPPAAHAEAAGLLAQYVGADGRTVVLQVATNASGFSVGAVSVLDAVRGRVSDFTASHPEIATVHYGGAAQSTQDLETLVDRTNEGMLIGAAVGLFVILLVILGSAFVPALALGAIGLSILWGWAGTYFVVGILENETLIFLLPLILLVMILGLGMDYNVLLLTRVREEREGGGRPVDAVQRAVTHAGGVITAAAVILGGAFLLLGLTSPLGILAGIGLGIGIAVLLQAYVVQTFLTPAVLALGGDAIWRGLGGRPPHGGAPPVP